MCSVNREKQLELQRKRAFYSRSDGVHGIAPRSVPMLRRVFLSSLAVIAAVSMAATPASAQRGHDRDQGAPRGDWSPREGREEQQQREVPLSSILRELRGRYGGQHLDASKSGGRWIIAWITEDGKRLTIEADAATGRILSTR